jgi:hypothetical protein
MTMTGMMIRASLATVLIAASIGWTVVGAYPDCSQHPSYNNGGGNYNGYEGEEQQGEGDMVDNGNAWIDEQPNYVPQWYPNNGVPMPRACTDPASNPRGYYNANLAPCRLQFHKITDDGNDSPYELSTACSDDNLVGSSTSAAAAGGRGAMFEYVSNWPDECVGDFKRCYSVVKDERIFISEACRHGIVFPDGATHVSLDCSEDKRLKQEATDKQNPTDASTDPYLLAQQKHLNEEIQEMEKVLFVIVGVILVSCLGCLCAAYALIVKPYQDTIKETRRVEREGLMMSNLDNNNNNNNSMAASSSSNGLSEARVV